MKLFILASALMLVLVFSSYVSANDPSDLDTAESQASFGYGYGTKVSNFMSSSEFNLVCLFVSRVGSIESIFAEFPRVLVRHEAIEMVCAQNPKSKFNLI